MKNLFSNNECMIKAIEYLQRKKIVTHLICFYDKIFTFDSFKYFVNTVSGKRIYLYVNRETGEVRENEYKL